MRMPLLLLTLLATPAAAQDLCEGNGYGGAYIQVGPAYLGGFFKHDLGSPNAPNSFVVFSFSDGADYTVHPVLGPVCLDIFSPIYDLIILPTDGTGNVHFELGLPLIPTWVTLPPFFSNAVTFEGGQWSSSKTVPLYFENANSWTPVSPMSEPRMYHTATALGAGPKDDRIKVFVAGGGVGVVAVPGASATTEIFDPLSRSFSPGPPMSCERATHTATRLPDGRVLIAGGLDDSGVCHRTCEIYDHSNGTIVPTGDMTTERAGHTATLLDDGRVLVTGGFQDYQNPATAWVAALNTVQDTAEIYDPATGAWTAVAQPMSAKRGAHSATELLDGRVMIVNGIRGGGVGPGFENQVPVFTATVDLFDPGTETFTPIGELELTTLYDAEGGRAFHGASVLADGRVLVCGGLYSGGAYMEAVSTGDCHVWNGATWSQTASVGFSTTSLQGQVGLRNGKVVIAGGLEADGHFLAPKSSVVLHTGTSSATQQPLGSNPGLPGGGTPDARGAMTATLLHDGSVLFLGGTVGDATADVLATGYVYTPAP